MGGSCRTHESNDKLFQNVSRETSMGLCGRLRRRCIIIIIIIIIVVVFLFFKLMLICLHGLRCIENKCCSLSHNL
jgi:hypothetical protein